MRAGASVPVLREDIDAVGVAFELRPLLRGVSDLLRSDDEDCAERHVSTRRRDRVVRKRAILSIVLEKRVH